MGNFMVDLPVSHFGKNSGQEIFFAQAEAIMV